MKREGHENVGCDLRNEESFPLFVYSYSSKGFSDVVDRIRHSLPYIPSYLISLYDYKHVIPPDLITSDDERLRIWDSGIYEIQQHNDMSSVYPVLPGSERWNENDYVESARNIPWNGNDVLVNYDYPRSANLTEQIERSLILLDEVDGSYLKDLILHLPDEPRLAVLVETLEQYIDEFDILGLIEKEIAQTWISGVRFIHNLRIALSSLSSDRYIPIHIFGCFDPKTIIRFAIAGADIFDGLTWMRYLFLNNSAVYKKEVEYNVDFDSLISAGNLELSIMLHNIGQMERLRSDLTYAITVDDMSEFMTEHSDVRAALECSQGGGDN